MPEKRFRSSKLDRLQSTWTSVSVLRTFPKSGKTGEVTDCSVVMDWLPFSWHVNELDFSAFLSLLRFIWMREELRCLWWFIWFWACWIFTGWEEGTRLRALVVEGLNNAGRSTRHTLTGVSETPSWFLLRWGASSAFSPLHLWSCSCQNQILLFLLQEDEELLWYLAVLTGMQWTGLWWKVVEINPRVDPLHNTSQILRAVNGSKP